MKEHVLQHFDIENTTASHNNWWWGEIRQLNTKRDTPAEHGRCHFFGHIHIRISIESSRQALSYYCSITYAVQAVKEIIGEKASMGDRLIP